MMEEMRNKAEVNKVKKMVIRMIQAGEMSLEEIADYTELSIEAVKELEMQHPKLV